MLMLSQEIFYKWSTGKLKGGKKQLKEARKILLDRFDYDERMQSTLMAAELDSSASGLTKDEWDWQIREWNDREGELLIAPGREWAFVGAVKME
jgi:hypothetical protein